MYLPYYHAESIIPGGIYIHYKGNRYLVMGFETDSETLEERVSYICMRTGKKWSRPRSMWSEAVEWPDGIVRARFTLEGDASLEPLPVPSEPPAP